MIKWDLGTLPVTSQVPQPAICPGKSEGKGNLTVVSVYTLRSHITMKPLLMLFKYMILCLNTNNRQNKNFTVP